MYPVDQDEFERRDREKDAVVVLGIIAVGVAVLACVASAILYFI